jgi:glycosyltransferase involved in cell wall biosynthesis
LVWIGDGPDAELLRAASAELPSLTWIPSLPDAQSYLGELDVFVLASRYEGAPYAPLEAMRAGVPVVLSDVVGNRDLIRDGENGSLVSPGDPGDLARALLILIDRADLRARLGQAGRESVKNGRNVVDTAQATASLYRRLAGGGGAPITAPNGFPQNRDVLSEFGHPRANRYDSTDDGIASTLPPRETT